MGGGSAAARDRSCAGRASSPRRRRRARHLSTLVARLQKTIVFFGVLESAVVFAAVALIVSPPAWPLLAALFPLAVMALNLPSRQS